MRALSDRPTPESTRMTRPERENYTRFSCKKQGPKVRASPRPLPSIQEHLAVNNPTLGQPLRQEHAACRSRPAGVLPHHHRRVLAPGLVGPLLSSFFRYPPTVKRALAEIEGSGKSATLSSSGLCGRAGATSPMQHHELLQNLFKRFLGLKDVGLWCWC